MSVPKSSNLGKEQSVRGVTLVLEVTRLCLNSQIYNGYKSEGRYIRKDMQSRIQDFYLSLEITFR